MEGGLNYSNIKQSVSNATIDFREGLAELFEILDVSVDGSHDTPRFCIARKMLTALRHIKGLGMSSSS